MKQIKVLTPKELRIFIAQYNLSHDQVADIMGYGKGGVQIIGAYCKGKIAIPKWESWEKLNKWENENENNRH